jgi:ribosomal protein S18 acetylase RimI-like enzyme
MAESRRFVSLEPPGLQLRPITGADLPFLAALYASTRQEELAPVPWTGEQKAAFLQWQFQSQHTYYQEYYPTCEFLVIEVPTPAGPRPAGRLYIDRWPEEIRLVDIALLPEHRGEGLGTGLLAVLLEEAEASRLPLTIHVEHNNPARRLYERLGFRHIDTNGVYHLMRWDPPAAGETGP